MSPPRHRIVQRHLSTSRLAQLLLFLLSIPSLFIFRVLFLTTLTQQDHDGGAKLRLPQPSPNGETDSGQSQLSHSAKNDANSDRYTEIRRDRDGGTVAEEVDIVANESQAVSENDSGADSQQRDQQKPAPELQSERELQLETEQEQVQQQQHDPLNIVLFYADDWSFRTLGAMEKALQETNYKVQPFVRTPNIDKLAQNGVLFTHNCVTTSICMVSIKPTQEHCYDNYFFCSHFRFDFQIRSCFTIKTGKQSDTLHWSIC